MITTIPPDMLLEAVSLIKDADYCPATLNVLIIERHRKDFEYVQWLFRAFGGTYSSELAINMISFYKRNF